MKFIKLFLIIITMPNNSSDLTKNQIRAYRIIRIYVAISKLNKTESLVKSQNLLNQITRVKNNPIKSSQILDICLERFNTLKKNESDYGPKFNQEVKQFVKEYY